MSDIIILRRGRKRTTLATVIAVTKRAEEDAELIARANMLSRSGIVVILADSLADLNQLRSHRLEKGVEVLLCAKMGDINWESIVLSGSCTEG